MKVKEFLESYKELIRDIQNTYGISEKQSEKFHAALESGLRKGLRLEQIEKDFFKEDLAST